MEELIANASATGVHEGSRRREHTMTAQKAYNQMQQTLRPPTARKIYHRLRKWEVRDTYSELHWFFGLDLTPKQLRQFVHESQGE